PEVVAAEPAEHDAVGAEKAGGLHFIGPSPSRRAIGVDVLRLAGPPYRHDDRGGDRHEPARRRDIGALHEDRRRVGVVEEPPRIERRRIVDGPAEYDEPWLA